MYKFQKDFLLGAATAAHQVEGNNKNSDFWAMEQMKYSNFTEPSLDAVDHYHRYQEDIKLLAEAGMNAYRFSIEWARIQPEEGTFDRKETEHYRKVIQYCRKVGVEPIVTLHHFSSPKWLIEKGGWEAETLVEDFAAYVRYIVAELGKDLKYICTINEANMRLQLDALSKMFIRQMLEKTGNASDGQVQVGMDLKKMMAGPTEAAEEKRAVFGTDQLETFLSPCSPQGDCLIMRAHEAARKEIKAQYPDMKVGLTLSIHDIQSVSGGEENAQREWEEEFLHYLPAIQNDDFLGIQNYTRSIYGADGVLPAPDGCEMTQMDYEFYPASIEHVLRKVAAEFKGDLLVTENGTAVSDDMRRVEYLEQATDGVMRCVSEGLPVKAYICWSLLDNFEWQKGYGKTFGLIEVDRTTQTRHPKPSLAFLGSMREKL